MPPERPVGVLVDRGDPRATFEDDLDGPAVRIADLVGVTSPLPDPDLPDLRVGGEGPRREFRHPDAEVIRASPSTSVRDP